MFGKSWGDYGIEGCVSDPSQPASIACIPALFQNVVIAALYLAGFVAVIFAIIAGFKLMTSGGDPKQVDSARKTLVYAILGLFLVFLSFAIINLLAYTTGVDCIKFFGFTQCK